MMRTSPLAELKVLLLGGTGFLGSHLAKTLLNLGVTVRVFSQSAHQINMQHLRLECCAGNFVDGRGLHEALHNIDIVFHLISTTIPSTSNYNPILDVQSNLIGSLNLFREMREMGIDRIIYISSGGTVYGNPTILPVPETHPLNPLCSYGIVKAATENYLNMFSQLHQFKPTILR